MEWIRTGASKKRQFGPMDGQLTFFFLFLLIGYYNCQMNNHLKDRQLRILPIEVSYKLKLFNRSRNWLDYLICKRNKLSSNILQFRKILTNSSICNNSPCLILCLRSSLHWPWSEIPVDISSKWKVFRYKFLPGSLNTSNSRKYWQNLVEGAAKF